MKWYKLYNSLFAILRIENTNAKVVGTGFVIRTNPILILTCNHVVGEGVENNDTNIKYSITKISDVQDEFDLRNVQIGYIRAKKITRRPELDLAILEVDPSINRDVAEKLNLSKVQPLKLNFSKKKRDIGVGVEWMSTGALGDLTLTPRFFKGNIVATYITNHGYKFKNSQGAEQIQTMDGIRLIEVDQLFIPGSSGSPVINLTSGEVIGYVHGFKSWPIMTNSIMAYQAEIKEGSNSRGVEIKSSAPLVTSLSLGIDVRSIKSYLRENDFVRENLLHRLLKSS